MRNEFHQTINEKSLWTRSERLLLAVSGGLDSMVLLHLCSFLYNDIAVAHCNFQLREKDADADENLVKQICTEKGIRFHTISFDTREFANKNGISIEMAARDLRYDFFEKLSTEYNYDKILTAHHADDNAETLLLNLIKGTGVRGLSGIPVLRGKIVRPLLDFTKSELTEFAKKNNIPYRNDYTNSQNIYQRNKIRNEILPLLETINPSVVKSLCENARRFTDLRKLYENTISEKLKTLVNNDQINISALKEDEYSESIIYEWIRPYGFAHNIAKEVIKSLNHSEETIFYSEEMRLIKSRDYLSLSKRKDQNNTTFTVSKEGITTPIHLKIEEIDTHIELEKVKNIGYFDADKLSFPLELRHWKEKDRFKPFGMKGSKKVSEYFKNKKFDKIQKENAWLLCSNNTIIWIVDERTSDDFKIDSSTKKIIKITNKCIK